MTRSLPIDYYPEPVPNDPDELVRYLDEELHRISRAFLAQPVAMTVTETSIVNVTTVPNWQRLFLNQTPGWEVPGGSWDPVTAEWTCPQNGLFQHIVDLRVEPYGAGNKVYYAGVRLTIVHADGSPDTVVEAVDSGDDSFDLGVTLPVQLPSFIGDVLYTEATVVHDQFVGNTTINSSWQVNRISAA